jgi:dihydrofolate reductase
VSKPKVSVYIATSLDGFIARENGGLDWLERVNRKDGDDYGYAKFMGTVDAIVMGRNTYEIVLGFSGWPFEGKQVVVCTHRLLESRHGETTHTGPLRPLMSRLAEQGVCRVYLDGGVMVRQGLVEGLVDDLTISLIPVLLGKGIPLFGGGIPETGLKLVESRSFPTGLVQVSYARDGRA